MAKFASKMILAILALISALLISSSAIRLQTGSKHLGYSTVDLHSDGRRGPFADLYDQDIKDNTTFSAAPEPDFSQRTRLYLRGLIHEGYTMLWLLLGFVFFIVIPLTIDHVTNFNGKMEQMYMLFMMCTPVVYAIFAIWGVSTHVFVVESTVSKNLDIVFSAIIQLYTGMVVIVYWWFLFSCLDQSALASGSRSTHHHFHSFDLRFLMPKPFFSTPRKIEFVSHILYRYILVRVIGVIICLLVVRYVPHVWRFWVELLIELLLLIHEMLAHYWVDLFLEAIHHDLPSPLFHKMALYVQVLGLVSSFQEWILKLMCIFFYLFGMGGLFMITDVPFVQNILLMLEVVFLAATVYGRFTASAYLSFVLAMSSPDWSLSSKRN